MAADKFWFDFGVRENVLQKLAEIEKATEKLQDRMSGIMNRKDVLENAATIEQAFDKIIIAKKRIADARLLTTDANDLKTLDNMETKLTEIEKRLKNVSSMRSDLSKAKMGTKGYAKLLEIEENLGLALDNVRRKTGEITEKHIADERAMAAEEKRIDSLKDKYYELYRIRQQLQDAVLRATPGIDVTEANNRIVKATSLIADVVNAGQNGGKMPLSVKGAEYDEWLRGTKEGIQNLNSATDKYNKTLNTQESLLSNLERLELDTASQKNIAGIKKQTAEYNALEQKLREIQDLMSKVRADQASVKGGAAPLYTKDKINTELEAIQRRYNEALATGRQLEKDDADAKNRKAAATRKAAEALQMLSHVNSNLVENYNRIAEAGSRAHGITVQFQHQLAGYAGLYGVERILKSVITIGGQFEYQHKALQNILGDIQQANTLFSQLQDLAIESPKTFMELTSYTKQLAAYQIPADELFDTTKRLADLSSGLGVDMSRLILAFGQVRSAAVLRGQELRQFTEAGIPMVQALADEFTKLNGRVVTTGEVFELISKRAVPFEMVKKVMWDMTNEGGRFYNMQAELADTLYGKWQKLQDQWQITLGHIAEANSLSGQFLKGALEGIVAIAASLDKILPVLAMFGAGKLLKGMNSAFSTIRENSDQKALNTMLLAKNKTALNLERQRLWNGKQLTKVERDLVANRNKLVDRDYQLLAMQNQISAKKAQQLMLDGKIERAHFYRLLQMQGYTREQRKQIANNIMLGNTGANNKLLRGPETGMSKFLGGAWNMVGGWYGVATAAIGGIISLYSNAMQKAAEASDMGKGAANDMLSSLSEANSIYNELSKKKPDTADSYQEAINRMTYALKENGHYTDEIKKKTEDANLQEKYRILFAELQKVSDEYLRMKVNVEAYLEAANKTGGGNWFTQIFNDPMSKDIKDWSEANIEKRVSKRGLDRIGASLKEQLTRFYKDIERWNEKEMSTLDWSALFDKLSDYQKASFNNVLGRMAGSMSLPKEERQYWQDAADAVDRYRRSIAEVKEKEREVDSQMKEYTDKLFVALEDRASVYNLDWSGIERWSDDDIKRLSGWLNDIINSYNIDEDTKKSLREKIIGMLPSTVVWRFDLIAEPKNDGLSDWQRSVQKFFSDNKINIPVTAQSSLESIEKDLKSKRKQLQEQMDTAGGILIRVGLDVSNLPTNIDDFISKLPALTKKVVRKAYEDYKTAKAEDERTKNAETLGFNTTPKSSGSGSKKDDKKKKAIEEQKNLLDEIKKIRSEYEKYSEYFGDEKGRSMVARIFGITRERADEIIGDYYRLLDEIKGKLKSLGDKKGVTAVELLMAEGRLGESKKWIEGQLYMFERELNRQSKKWNLYKKIFDATGDRNQAANLVFGGNISFKNEAEELRSKLNEAIEKFPKAKKLGIDKLLDMNSEQLKGLGIPKKEMDGIYKMLRKLEDAKQSLESEDIELFLDALKNAKSLETELDQITLKYNKVRNAIKAQGGDQKLIDNADENEAREKAAKRWEWFKNTNVEWGRVFGNLDKMTTKTLVAMREQLEEMAPSLSEDVDSIKALYEAIEKIDKITSKRNPFAVMSDAIGRSRALRNLRKNGINDYGFRNANGTYTIGAKAAGKLGLSVNAKGEYTENDINDALRHTEEDFNEGLDGMVGKLKSVQEALTPVIDLFNAIGMSGLAEFFQIGSNALGAASQMGQGASSLFGAEAGPYGAAIGATLSIISSIFSAHDEELQQLIDASKDRQKILENLEKNLEKVLERTLGGVYNTKATDKDLNRLREYASLRVNGKDSIFGFGTPVISDADTMKAIFKALETESYFDTKYAELLLQRDELQRQLEAEKDKKDSDDGAIEDYTQQIAELDDEIKYFALDLAKTLYDIDVKSWASELGDALFEAWQRGEDGAEAFKKKANEIIADVSKNILVTKMIETAFKPVENYIEEMMVKNSGKLDPLSFVQGLIPLLEGAYTDIDATLEGTLDAIEAELQKRGMTMKEEGSSSTSSKVIQGGFNEEETGLLLSYVNALRADSAANRYTLDQILQSMQGIGEMPSIAQAQLTELRAISQNTRRNADIAADIYDILHKAQMGAIPIKVQ